MERAKVRLRWRRKDLFISKVRSSDILSEPSFRIRAGNPGMPVDFFTFRDFNCFLTNSGSI